MKSIVFVVFVALGAILASVQTGRTQDVLRVPPDPPALDAGTGTSRATTLDQAPPDATPTAKLGWDQAAPTVADASGYTYRYYPDGATTGTVFATITCTGTASPFLCSTPFPAFTPGSHTLTLTAGNVAGESAKSAVFAFVFKVIPSVPGNLRIIY